MVRRLICRSLVRLHPCGEYGGESVRTRRAVDDGTAEWAQGHLVCINTPSLCIYNCFTMANGKLPAPPLSRSCFRARLYMCM